MSLCTYVKILKTEEHKNIKFRLLCLKQKDYVILFLCLKQKRLCLYVLMSKTKKIMSLCSYVQN